MGLLHVPWYESMFTCSGAKRLRRGSAIILPLLNTRSDGTLVAGTLRYFLANFARWGEAVLWVYHHKSGSLVHSSLGCSRYVLISLLNCSPNNKLLPAGFSLGIATKMAPRPFAFLFFWRCCIPRIWDRRANWVTLGIWCVTGMDDFSLQFQFCQLSVSNVGSFESRVQDEVLFMKLQNESRFVACAEIPSYYWLHFCYQMVIVWLSSKAIIQDMLKNRLKHWAAHFFLPWKSISENR